MERAFVKPLPGYRLWLRFSDSAEGEVDLSPLVGVGVFAAWANPAEFNRVAVDPITRTVFWPGSIDLDPDVLYHKVTGALLPGLGDPPRAAG
jgi:hypothetical protein